MPMFNTWTVKGRLIAGFAVAGLTLILIAVVAYRNAAQVIENDGWVTHTYQVRGDLALLATQLTDAQTGERGYLITGDESFLAPYRNALGSLKGTLERLRQLTMDNPDQQRRLAALSPILETRLNELTQTVDLRRTDGLGAATVLAIGWLITSSLARQIAEAVNQVRSSSTELQAAANQQATGAKEQAAAMTEISTTITELLATSRQIAESAQRVAQNAEQTASAARSGHGTVDTTHELIGGIRRQVDQIVSHMLDLGKKSQEVGAVLDIVSELAEQTNILAINATIEAAGAGDAGKRFAVVADEIRKLADRVGDSTKEVRTLIEDVRSAVNTTVMATETGSKAVDAGSRQFGDVATAFRQIASLVGTTTEAAREIELSTKQQSSAVEQVNLAIASVTQASVETETSAGQTLQTVSQMAALSRDLLRIIQPQLAA